MAKAMDNSGQEFRAQSHDSPQTELALRQANLDLERRLAARTEELVQARLEMETFSYMLAHDLQAPVRNIKNYAQLLLEMHAPALPEEFNQILNRVSARADYMSQLISGLLNFSRLDKKELTLEHVAFKAVVDEVVALLKAESPGRKIEWKIQALPALPCDAQMMRQVFVNLLANAVKFTKLCPEAVIEIGQTTHLGEQPIYIRDNGVGFNMQHVSKLFRVFQRLHPPAEFEGTGMGLATVDRIIRKHGGRVWAETEEKKGATFYFTTGPAPAI